MAKLVVVGAMLQCSMGAAPSFSVSPSHEVTCPAGTLEELAVAFANREHAAVFQNADFSRWVLKYVQMILQVPPGGDL